MNKINILQTSV